MDNDLRQRLLSGETVYNGWLSIPDGFAAEVMGTAPWDSLTIDLQHGVQDYLSMVRCLQATTARAIPTLVRVSANDAAQCGKVLDAGATGVICPLVNSAEEADAFVRACRYPPEGVRSNGPVRAALGTPPGSYQQGADATILRLAMIETRAGLDALEEIASVPGLDGLYIGPTDLALSLGIAPRLDTDDPTVLTAMDTILAAAQAHGIVPGVHTGSAAYARQMADKGFRFVTVGTDALYLGAGARQALQDVRG